MGTKLSMGRCRRVIFFLRTCFCPRPSRGLALAAAPFAVEPKFVCLTHSEAKRTKSSEFGGEKYFLTERAPTEKMGDIGLFQIHLPGWSGHMVFKGMMGVRAAGGMNFF